MKTLILSRLALFGMLFTVLVVTQFKKPDKISPTVSASTQVGEASNSIQAVNADVDLTFGSESPAAISFASMPRANEIPETRRKTYFGNEQNLIYRQSLFEQSFKPNPLNENYHLSFAANNLMNKSSPIRR